MAGIDDKRAGRRFGRRPALLLALGLALSLGATGALAGVMLTSSAPRQIRHLAIRVAPATRTVAPGATATYAVRVTRFDHRRIGVSGRTELAIHDGGLPTGANASIGSRRHLNANARLASRARTTVTITTAADTPPGTYEVRLGARRPHRSGSASIELTVSRLPGAGGPISTPPRTEPLPGIIPPGPPVTTPSAFTVAGALPNLLSPGKGEQLDLTLTNLESTDLLIASLGVEVATVSGPRTDPEHRCGSDDFAVKQFSGALGFTLPASSSADLGELGFDRSDWPAISMLNRPVNQDGCKGASLVLSFTGTATEASS